MPESSAGEQKPGKRAPVARQNSVAAMNTSSASSDRAVRSVGVTHSVFGVPFQTTIDSDGSPGADGADVKRQTGTLARSAAVRSEMGFMWA